MTAATKKIRTRFAPSPTGFLHIGGLRTALYNYLFARRRGGEFLLRIEDTDRTRLVEGAVENLEKSLRWAGLSWDNNTTPVVQSDRLAIYREHAEKLISEGKAYRCFCTPQHLEEMRRIAQEKKLPPKYDRRCLEVGSAEAARRAVEGEKFVVRLRVPDKEEVSFRDTIRGDISFRADLIDDQVLLKSDGFPTYHLASVVDDHLMEITHIIRGEEWLSSTPKHILLYRAFGWEPPHFAHLPLLLNPDRSKLSKRQGDVSVEDYAKKGYLPEAFINFCALLGWNPGEGSEEEIFSLAQLEKQFDLAAVNKAGAVFDVQKLNWMNARYIKSLPLDELYRRALPFAREKKWFSLVDENFLQRVLEVERDRLQTLLEVGEKNPFFFSPPRTDRELLRWKNMSDEEVFASLEKARTVLDILPSSDWKNREAIAIALTAAAGDNKGEFFWPLRTALSGEKKSPPPHDIAYVVGKEETLRRIERSRE